MYIRLICFMSINMLILLFFTVFHKKTDILETNINNSSKRFQSYYEDINLGNIELFFDFLFWFSVVFKMLIFLCENISNDIRSYKHLAYIILWKLTRVSCIFFGTFLLIKVMFYSTIYWYSKYNENDEVYKDNYIEIYHKFSCYYKPWIVIMSCYATFFDCGVVVYDFCKKLMMVYKGNELPEIGCFTILVYCLMIICGLVVICLLTVYIWSYYMLLAKSKPLIDINIPVLRVVTALISILSSIFLLFYEAEYLKNLETIYNIS
ncbi:hypothetical protein CWI39_0967p0010 [Hamiltosporidium magnivora]|uniref:Uncharacterized protein n=1 Tax=Hamiltosporidium magnivora TaxID=148818 RepID=A0A4V2JVB6_9MICR|nr:hypothetical protein CWI39_0967p0010 [Hamiltosporidium magnivora]